MRPSFNRVLLAFELFAVRNAGRSRARAAYCPGWGRMFLMAALLNLPIGAAGASGVRVLAQGNETFAFDLYAKLKETEGNLFFSPYSISECLGMVYAGASGTTADQMARVLHFTTSQEQVASAFGDLQQQLRAIEQKKGIQLDIANGLWAQEEHPFLPTFLAVARTAYKAEVAQVNFRAAPELVRSQVNSWVAGKTRDKIKNLLSPGTIDATTRLLLVNAIYFKGEWTRQFKESETADAPFTVSSGQRVQARMMHLTAHFNYADLKPLQLLELPYAEGDLAMVVLLPKSTDGLKTLETSLSSQTLNACLGRAHSREVTVFLPKFKLIGQFTLAQTLAAMGMPEAFSPAADFSQMDGARDLVISAVVHKAFVDVNEQGTEAAAATGAAIRMLAVRPQPVPTFRADHPFIFLIRDTRSGSILFLGRVADPTSSGAGAE